MDSLLIFTGSIGLMLALLLVLVAASTQNVLFLLLAFAVFIGSVIWKPLYNQLSSSTTISQAKELSMMNRGQDKIDHVLAAIAPQFGNHEIFPGVNRYVKVMNFYLQQNGVNISLDYVPVNCQVLENYGLFVMEVTENMLDGRPKTYEVLSLVGPHAGEHTDSFIAKSFDEALEKLRIQGQTGMRPAKYIETPKMLEQMLRAAFTPRV